MRRMLMSLLLLGFNVCPIAAQTVDYTYSAECVAVDNIYRRLGARTQISLNGSMPGALLESYIIAVDDGSIGWQHCNPVRSSWNTCSDVAVADGDKTAKADGYSTYGFVGTFHFDQKHYVNRVYQTPGSGTGPTTMRFSTTCPQPSGGQQVCSYGCGSSPIIIPLHTTNHGNQVKLSSVEDGVTFDINGDGVLDQVAWPVDDTAGFLALDRDGDGAITSGKELFGSAAIKGINNGFDVLWELSKTLKDRVDGPLTAREMDQVKLVIWIDHNRNGVSEADELVPASQYLTELSFGGVLVGKKDQFGNEFRYQGTAHYVEKPEEPRPIYDVILKVQ